MDEPARTIHRKHDMGRMVAIIGPALRDVHRQYEEIVHEAIQCDRSHIADCLEIIEKMP